MTKQDRKEVVEIVEKIVDRRLKQTEARLDRKFLRFHELITEEMKHHMGALLDAFNDKLDIVIDMVKGVNDKVQNHEQRITILEEKAH